jgi:hypothetical protein
MAGTIMKVAVKYCGGCDPTYDRVELVQLIKNAAGNSIEWVPVDEEDQEAILLVCGCLTACPEEELRHQPCVSVRCDGLSPEDVVAQILEKGQTDANQD